MTTQPTSTTAQQAPVAGGRAHPVNESTRLAIDRTRLAHERTLMAWVRTAVSLISFGFTIYKFFQGLQDAQRIEAAQRVVGPRGFGLIMIGLGVGSLVLATIQHRSETRALAAEFSQYGPFPRSTSTVVAMVVGGLGVLALVIVILRQ